MMFSYMGKLMRVLVFASWFLLKEAIELDPEQIKALWLLGMDNFLVGEYENALARWEQMLPLVPEDSSMHRAVQAETRRARRLLDRQP